MRSTASLLVAMLAVIATGCESGRPVVATVLADVLAADVVLDSVGETGFIQNDAATGSMPLETAARATTVRSDVLGDFLGESGYQGGFARVLTRGEEFVTLLAYELADDQAAVGLVNVVVDELAGSAAYRPFDDPTVAGSRGFILTSDVAGEVRFCVGEWFAVGRRAYGVTRCAPFVLSVPAVTGIAAAQHQRATERGRT